MKNPLIILTGPTAVGKTKLSIELAKAVGGEIISADSMQVYRHMDIGSAKITTSEMAGVVHHLVDILEPREAFSVTEFQTRAKAAIQLIYERGHIPILVGGTGFYIQAVVKDIVFSEHQADDGYRRELERIGSENGSLYLHDMLSEIDEESAAAIHANNQKRVIRALEYYHQTGSKISEHNSCESMRRSPYNFAYFVLNDSREDLYARIDKRVDGMMAEGLLEEVKTLQKMGCHGDMVSMKGLGYKELLAYLEGECILAEAVYTIKRDTRRFAKRQLTWFKRERDVIWIEKEQFAGREEKILKFMVAQCRKLGIIC